MNATGIGFCVLAGACARGFGGLMSVVFDNWENCLSCENLKALMIVVKVHRKNMNYDTALVAALLSMLCRKLHDAAAVLYRLASLTIGLSIT